MGYNPVPKNPMPNVNPFTGKKRKSDEDYLKEKIDYYKNTYLPSLENNLHLIYNRKERKELLLEGKKLLSEWEYELLKYTQPEIWQEVENICNRNEINYRELQ